MNEVELLTKSLIIIKQHNLQESFTELMPLEYKSVAIKKQVLKLNTITNAC